MGVFDVVPNVIFLFLSGGCVLLAQPVYKIRILQLLVVATFRTQFGKVDV